MRHTHLAPFIFSALVMFAASTADAQNVTITPLGAQAGEFVSGTGRYSLRIRPACACSSRQGGPLALIPEGSSEARPIRVFRTAFTCS